LSLGFGDLGIEGLGYEVLELLFRTQGFWFKLEVRVYGLVGVRGDGEGLKRYGLGLRV
jgi:hypothetical protein